MSQREEHVGIVRDNEDPLMRGRLLIECPTIVSGESLGEWVEPCFHFVDSSQNAGCMWIPNIGSTVTVSIEAEEDSEVTGLDPKWKCDIYPNDTVPDEFKTNYPNRRGWVTKEGHTFIFDDTEGDLEFYYKHPSGAEIRITNDGEISLTPASGQSVKVGGSDATEALVLGDELTNYFNGLGGLISSLSAHVHSGVLVGLGNTGTPTSVFPSLPNSVLSPDNKVK